MTLAAFLVAMVGPLIARILASLGLSLVTLTGLTVAVTAIKAHLTTAVGGLPATVSQLGGLMGIWECMGIVLGTYTFLIAWKSTTGFIALAKT